MIDTHCHLNFSPLSERVDEVIALAEEVGVHEFIVPGTDLASSKQGIELSSKYPHVYAAVGIHPHDAGNENTSQIEELLMSYPEIVAVGEVGLDYYRLSEKEITLTAQVQKAMFSEMLNLAERYQKPIIVHTRASHLDTLELLKNCTQPVLVHSFSGSASEAADFLERGYYLSVNGIITFTKNDELRAIVAKLPIEKILLETDAPFLAPQGFRGQTNEPARVSAVATCLAGLKGLTVEVLDKITTENAHRFFNLPQ